MLLFFATLTFTLSASIFLVRAFFATWLARTSGSIKSAPGETAWSPFFVLYPELLFQNLTFWKGFSKYNYSLDR
jgi:energy-coupling factor transporter transmembrane protein EcfT